LWRMVFPPLPTRGNEYYWQFQQFDRRPLWNQNCREASRLTDPPYLSVNSSALCQSHERLSQKVHPSPPLGDAPVSIDPPETRGLCISQRINTLSNLFNPLYSPTISFVSQQTPCRNSVRIARNERTNAGGIQKFVTLILLYLENGGSDCRIHAIRESYTSNQRKQRISNLRVRRIPLLISYYISHANVSLTMPFTHFKSMFCGV